MWAPIVPTPEVMRHAAENFPDLMLGYLRVFYKQPPTQDAFRARAASSALSLDDVLASLDAAGIDRTLVTGFDEGHELQQDVHPERPGRRPHRALPVKPAVLERWLGGNALALLGER